MVRPHARRRPGLGLPLLFPRLAILLACTATPAATSAPPVDALYTGTVAGGPVAAVLRVEAGAVRSGTYFYRRRGRDIALVPDADKRHLLECSAEHAEVSDEPCAGPTGAWSVDLSGDRVTGTWRTTPAAQAGKPIALAREASVPAGRAWARYEEIRREAFSFVDVSRHERAGLSWKVVKERQTGVTGPLLLSGPGPAALARVNAELKARLLDDAASAVSPGEHDVSHTVEHASARLFAVSTHTGWDTPGAAHPSNGFEAITWDLATGERVDWARLVRLVDPKAPRLDLARKDLLAAVALRRLAAADGEGEEDCLGVPLGVYSCDEASCAAEHLYPGAPVGIGSWTLFATEAGLAVAPGVYSEAERGCRGERVVVPWADLRPTLLVDRPLP